MELSQQKVTDVNCIKISHLENRTGVEFCIDNLLNQLAASGFIKHIMNRYVIRWPHGLGVECVDTECFILLSNDNDMEALLHYFDGYHFHNKPNTLKAEWGWFTFRNSYHPLAATRPCVKCDSTFKSYVRDIEDELLNGAIQARIIAINKRNQQQRQDLYIQHQTSSSITAVHINQQTPKIHAASSTLPTLQSELLLPAITPPQFSAPLPSFIETSIAPTSIIIDQSPPELNANASVLVDAEETPPVTAAHPPISLQRDVDIAALIALMQHAGYTVHRDN